VGIEYKQCETQLLTIYSGQMKQNSIFSCVKRNNNNSEGVDGNDEQYSSNVKEALPPKRRSGIQLPRLENGTTRI